MTTSTNSKPAPRTKPATHIVTGKVRFSYAHVFTPKAVEDGGELKYSCALIVDKTDADTLKAIDDAVDAAIKIGREKYGKAFANKDKLKLPLRDGDTEKDGDEDYEGKYWMNASGKKKPGIVGRNGKTELTSEDEFYSGCFGRAAINFYPFSMKGNAGVAVGLNNLMKLEDGERLSGGASAQTDFADFAEDDGGDVW